MTNWTKEELLAYILIYCSDADTEISEEEKAYLKTRLDEEMYERMLITFDKDSDDERIAKIREGYNNHDYSDAGKDLIYEDIHNIFSADGDYDAMESQILDVLKKILV